MYKKIWILVWVVLLIGCTNQQLNIRDFQKYINNPQNGLVKDYESDLVLFTAKFVPADLSLYNELSNTTASKPNNIGSLRKQYEDNYTFHLIIQPKTEGQSMKQLILGNANSAKDVTDLYDFLNYELSEHVYLKAGESKIFPVLYTLESNSVADRKLDFMFIFPKPESTNKAEELLFMINPDIFQEKAIAFPFEQDNLNDIPVLSDVLKYENI